MLFDYRFQLQQRRYRPSLRCDLMLFDYRFQYTALMPHDARVVI